MATIATSSPSGFLSTVNFVSFRPRTHIVRTFDSPALAGTSVIATWSGVSVIGPTTLPVAWTFTSGRAGWSVATTISSLNRPSGAFGLSVTTSFWPLSTLKCLHSSAVSDSTLVMNRVDALSAGAVIFRSGRSFE